MSGVPRHPPKKMSLQEKKLQALIAATISSCRALSPTKPCRRVTKASAEGENESTNHPRQLFHKPAKSSKRWRSRTSRGMTIKCPHQKSLKIRKTTQGTRAIKNTIRGKRARAEPSKIQVSIHLSSAKFIRALCLLST